MKLKIVKNLMEADSSRGALLVKLDKINAIIEKAISNKYKFKSEGYKGFYIIPRFNYLSKILISNEDEKYIVKILDSFGKDSLSVNFDSAELLIDNWKEKVCKPSLDIIFNITQEEISKLKSASVTEAITDFIVDKIKKGAEKFVDTIDKKAAKKAQNKNIKAIAEICINKLTETLKEKSENHRIEIKKKITGSSIELTLNGIILGVSYLAYPSKDKKIKINKCFTSLTEYKDLSLSLANFITFLNRKLGVQIKIADDELLKSTGSNDSEIQRVRSFENELKDILGNDILAELEESLTEKLGDFAYNYNKALAKVTKDEQGIALIKLYFYKESGNVLKLSDAEAEILYNDIKAAKAFDPDKSKLFGIVVNYYNKYKSSNKIEKAIGNLIYILNKNDFITKIKDADSENSLMYDERLIGNDLTSKDIQDIYIKYNNIKAQKLSKQNIEKILSEINTKLPDIKIDKNTINQDSSKGLADLMIYNQDKIRNIEEIKLIYNIITGGDNTYKGTEQKPALKNQPGKNQLLKVSEDDVKEILKIFNDAKIDADELNKKSSLFNKLKANPESKEILKKLLAEYENIIN